MIIKDWWYAYKVCKKYGIKWKLCGDGEYDWRDMSISVSPFRENFMSVFLHEIGHHVDHKIRNYDRCFHSYGLVYSDNKRGIYCSMDAEGKASRFAVKDRQSK